MSGLTFKLRGEPSLRLDLRGLVPAKLAGHSLADIERSTLATEAGSAKVGDYFAVGGAEGDTVTIAGGSDHLDFVGTHLGSGKIIVDGPVGAYAGADMRGGQIEIHGDAGAYLAAEGRGGVIRVKGSAGDYLGGARAGRKFGLMGTLVVVGGSVGTRAGERMRRGIVLAKGGFGHSAGSRMVGGTLWTETGVGPGPGPLLRRGTLIGPAVEGLLPTFADCGRHDLVILRILSRYMTEMLGPLAPPPLPGTVRRLAGDMATIGKGEILLTA
jgi:formylmethanofuran dehydrogenase subunit C